MFIKTILKVFIPLILVSTFIAFMIGQKNGINSPLGAGVYHLLAWSPDGVNLAFIYYQQRYDELWLLNTNTQQVIKLSDRNIDTLSGAAWQDENTLFFISDGSLYKVNTIDKKDNLIWDDAHSWEGFTFDIDKENITFSKSVGPFNEYHPNDLYTLDLQARKITQLTNTPNISEMSPLWSPNGQYLAFTTYTDANLAQAKEGAPAIEVQRSKGDSSILNLPVPSGINHFAWSPDGQYIIFRGQYNSDAGLYFVKTGSKDQPIKVPLPHEANEGLSEISWSPDGAKIAYTTVGIPGKNNLYITRIKELKLNLLP